jgi:hypothetical protein
MITAANHHQKVTSWISETKPFATKKMIDMMIDEQNTIFHDEKMLLKLPDPCFVGAAVKIDDFSFHKYSLIQIASFAIFQMNSDNRKEGLQCNMFGFVVQALVMENGSWNDVVCYGLFGAHNGYNRDRTFFVLRKSPKKHPFPHKK